MELRLVNLARQLEAYAADAAALYRERLERDGKVASRDLVNSISTAVEVDGAEYRVTMDLADYWKFVEGGSRGTVSSPAGAVYRAHFPPPSALMRWIEVKPVIPRPDSRGRLPSPRSLAYLIGRKIERFGIEPVPALAATMEELNERYAPLLRHALAEDVREYLLSTVRA